MTKKTLEFEGNILVPAESITIDWESFVDTFVVQPNMARRTKIFEAYTKYLADLRKVLGTIPFVQWVNGSFVTKKTNPNDIDIVTFLPLDICNTYSNQLQPLTNPKVKAQYEWLVDAYIIPIDESSRNTWFLDFSSVKSRDKKLVHGQKKGFIELFF